MTSNAWGADDWAGLARAGLGQGLAMGWGDEIEAAARAAQRVPDGRNFAARKRAYDEELAAIRGQMGAFKVEHPNINTAAEIGGGLIPTVGMLVPGLGEGIMAVKGAQAGNLAVRAAPTLAGAVGRSALREGALGALQGAGTGDTMADRALGAAISAPIGAVVGGAVPLLSTPLAVKVAKRYVAPAAGAVLAGGSTKVKKPKTREERLKEALDDLAVRPKARGGRVGKMSVKKR
jgi:hypothetical protein